MEAGSGAVRYVAHRSPPLEGGKIQSCSTRGTLEPSLGGRHDPELQDLWCTRAVPCREAGSGAARHVAHQSPTLQGGGVRSHCTCHSAGTEPFLSGWWDPEPLGTWQPRTPPWLGGRVRRCRARGDALVHAPLLVLI
jgi:hypothetical protein